jgi:hypothetical protein
MNTAFPAAASCALLNETDKISREKRRAERCFKAAFWDIIFAIDMECG